MSREFEEKLGAVTDAVRHFGQLALDAIRERDEARALLLQQRTIYYIEVQADEDGVYRCVRCNGAVSHRAGHDAWVAKCRAGITQLGCSCRSST